MSSKKGADNGSNTNAQIIFCAGGKGGVGKSILSIATTDTLYTDGVNPVLIESDTSNPDVYKIYGDVLDHRLMNLDTVDGWMDLVNFADEMKGRTIVVNTAARSQEGLQKFGKMLSENLPELGRELITFWVINRQRDSLELLRDYMDYMPQSRIRVFRNGYFGEEHKFELYNGSKLKETVEASGGRSFNFPDLADRVTDELYSRRVPVHVASQDLPMGNRAELRRWRVLAQDVIRDALN